jgi:hypothetical protein
VWTVRELTSSTELALESQAMQHLRGVVQLPLRARRLGDLLAVVRRGAPGDRRGDRRPAGAAAGGGLEAGAIAIGAMLMAHRSAKLEACDFHGANLTDARFDHATMLTCRIDRSATLEIARKRPAGADDRIHP